MLRATTETATAQRRAIAAALLLLTAACHGAAQPAAAPTPSAGQPSATIPADSPVRVTIAGRDGGWLAGTWVVTGGGCLGVLLADEQLLAMFPTLTSVEVAAPSAGGVDRWRPVALTDIRDGDGCDRPADP